MSERDSNSESGSGHHNIVLTPEEKKVFGQLFQAADSDKLGVVIGDLAVKFFEKSGLNQRILGEIWGIADTENQGLLTKVGFSVALRLIGQAQNGQHPRPELAQHPGPLPKFEGVNITYPPPPMTSSPPPPPPPPIQPAQISGPGMIRVPPLTPQDVEKFTGLFEKSGAQDGVLPGDVAKGIFQRAKLPNQTLGLIWNLADRQHRGALGPAEFVVAMHLITCSKNGSLAVLPQILPPGLYEAAAGRLLVRNGPDRRGAGRGIPPPALPPVPPIPKQFSGQQQRAQSPLSRQFTPPITQTVPRQGTGDWAISAADKARFDQVFLTIDKQNRGFITGEEAVPFFGNSNLPEDILASIWDLADITKAGRLNRDEFAIAMYLIRQQRNSPGTNVLPETLPPNLTPPSMRQPQQYPSQSSPSAPSAYEPPPPPVPPPPPKTASDDLFELDFSSTPPPPPPPPPPPSTSAPPQTSLSPFDTDVFGIKSAPVTGPTTPIPPQQTPSFFNSTAQRSFVPTSSFGQNMISPSQTGGSTSSAPASRAPPSVMEDLLGDADPEVSKKLTNETTELANLSNQIGTLTKQTTELKSKRASAEQELSTLSTQKQHIEMQLSALRSAYEREAEHVKAVEGKLAASKSDTTRLRNDYSVVEASYNELQTRKQELTSALESDKRENESLSQRMKALNAENINLRQELERLQSQTRQQRGLVAINKKQVSTGEQERERLRGEIEDAKREIVSPPPPGSPTPSTASLNTNPFHRRNPPAAPESAFSPSPFAPGNTAPTQSTTLEDVFGPSYSNVSPMPTGSSLKSFQRTQTEPSASEGGNAEHSTPPTSPPGSSYHGSPPASEVPPVSAAVQLNPSFLPFQVSRADSLSSSVQVNPSASQQGDNEFSRPDTPTHWATTSEAPAKEREAFVKPEDRRSSFSVKSDAGTEASAKVSFPGLDGPGKEKDRSPFGVERNTTGSTTGGMKPAEKRDSFSSYGTPSSNIPGAFSNFDSTAPIKPTATGESTMSNKSSGSGIGKGFSSILGSNRSDSFSELRNPATSKDFDEAFKSFAGRTQEHQHTGGSSSRFDKEFPPIEEVGRDEDSDSDNDKGFEDNFTSSPKQPPTTSPAPVEKDNIGPLGIGAQASPPAYTVGAKGGLGEKNQNPFPEYSGLPSRSDPMKHGADTPGGSSNAVVFPGSTSVTTSPQHTGNAPQSVFGGGSNNLFSSSSPATFPPPTTTPAPPPANPSLSDDFDDDFGDLADAKEVDDKGDEGDDFGGFDDFNPVFEHTHGGNGIPPGTAVGGDDDDFTAFNFNVDSPGAQQGGGGTGSGGATVGQEIKKASSQDWDAIFADLEPSTGTQGGGEDTGAGTVTDAESGGVKLGEEEGLNKLTGLGFGRERAAMALKKSGGDLDQAANSLLSEGEVR